MADINRANSPMNIYREDILETKEEIDHAQSILHDQLNLKAPFLVGSIERVNEKIANLDRELQMFSSLVIDSRGSNVEENRTPSPAPEGTCTKAQEMKQLNQFAGVYSVKSSHHFSNETALLSDSKQKLWRRAPGTKKPKEKVSSTRPKLVELHQYPGFETDRLTPLPYVDVLKILERLTNAQTGLSKKHHYKAEFQRLFFSKMSEAILVDLFWWFFLHRYHPSKTYQEKMFDRVAHNYTKLLLYAKHPKYRDVFFKAYSDLLAQSVYCCFCEAFPDSWRQFNDDFKEDLCMLTSQWVAGTKVVPRTWMMWNYKSIEPQDMRKAEIIQKDSKKGRVLHFEFLTPLSSSHNETSVKQSESSQDKPSQEHHANSNLGVTEIDSDIKTIATISNAQKDSKSKTEQPQRSEGKGKSTLQPIAENISDASGSLISQKTVKSSGTSNSQKSKKKTSEVDIYGKKKRADKGLKQSTTTMSFQGQERPLSPESHPVYENTQFSKSAFNVCGQSPLVTHFMRQKKLDKRAGMNVYLQRTDIKSLPPLNAPTYRELISDAYHSIRELDHSYQEMHEEGLREHAQFLTKQKKYRKSHMRKEKLLMSKPREVKRLSDLLVLELLKDEDEVSTGAALSVQAALMNQEDK